jgi:hypothetical protein
MSNAIHAVRSPKVLNKTKKLTSFHTNKASDDNVIELSMHYIHINCSLYCLARLDFMFIGTLPATQLATYSEIHKKATAKRCNVPRHFGSPLVYQYRCQINDHTHFITAATLKSNRRPNNTSNSSYFILLQTV